MKMGKSGMTAVFSAMALAGALSAEGVGAHGGSDHSVVCKPENELLELFKAEGLSATGEKGKTPKFDMEIYAAESGKWAILGKPLGDQPGVKPGEVCKVGGEPYGYPGKVHNQPWYKKFFDPKTGI